MNKDYRQIILGATFYGCGLAAVSPDDTLVIEPSILVGSDFTLNFNPGQQWDYVPSHAWAREFLRDLSVRNALEDGRIHQPALCPVFSKWCLDHNLNIALSTTVLNVNDNQVEIFDVEGRHVISADQIVDASPKCGLTKRITASLLTAGQWAGGAYGPFEIIAGRFSSEAFLLMELPVTVAWPEARLTLFNAWKQRPEVLRESSIAAVASQFDYHNFINRLLLWIAD